MLGAVSVGVSTGASGGDSTLACDPDSANRPAIAVAARSAAHVPVLAAVSIGCVVVVGALGPSAAVSPAGTGSGAPPGPGPWLVTGLLALAVAAGAAATALGLRALASGWAPAPRRMLATGALAVLALLLVPPVGSADVASHAAYGRLAATGGDPWVVPPSARPDDPAVAVAEDPWRDTPSVYGPLATAEQLLAARIGGVSGRVTVRVLAVLAGLAFLGTGLLLDRAAPTAAARRRAALLWTTNPVLLLVLVAGAHLDALTSLLLAGGALAACRGRRGVVGLLLAGLLLGLVASVKASAAVPSAGVLLGLRRRALLPAVVALGVAAAAVVLAGGPHVMAPVLRAGRMVSAGTGWRSVASLLEPLFGAGTGRSVTLVAAAAVSVWLARRLLPRVPARPAPLMASLAVSTAWTLAAPYAMPWYDAMPLVLLAAVAASGLDQLLVVHTAALALAYLPGRTVPLPDGLHAVLVVARSGLTPVVLLVLLVLVARLPRRSCLRGGQQADRTHAGPGRPRTTRARAAGRGTTCGSRPRRTASWRRAWPRRGGTSPPRQS